MMRCTLARRSTLAGLATLIVLGHQGCDGNVELQDVAVQIEVSEHVGTVVTVSWSTDEVTTGWFEWGLDETYGRQRSSEAGESTQHEVVLLGLLPDTTYTYRVQADLDSEIWGEATGEFTTSPLPPELQGRTITAEVRQSGVEVDGYLYTTLAGTPYVPVILDREGRIVWWYIEDTVDILGMIAVRPSCDGKHVNFNRIIMGGESTEPIPMIFTVSMDGSDVVKRELVGHHHDFLEIDGGILAATFDDMRNVDDEMVLGDRIVEIAPDGTQTEIWSVWDTFEWTGVQPVPGIAWTHGNALNFDPEQQAYYISLRGLSCVVKVDRATGETLWILGGDDSDFTFDSGEPFAEQHQFQVLDDGIILFDNGHPSRQYSRALGLDLDLDQMVASSSWSHTTDPAVMVVAGGDVQRLPSGNTLVVWSTAGQMDEIDASGELLWTLNADLGTGFFYAEWQQDLYDPILESCGD